MKKLLHPLTRLLLAVGLSAFSVVAFAQKTAVNGIVTDAEGAPLVGATVIVMQNARPEGGGTTTNTEGKFTVNASQGQQLAVSYIGYREATVEVTSKTFYEIALQSDSEQIDDVVVVGYGTQKKVNVTGSVSTIDASTFEKRPVVSASVALQGMAPGVTVTTPSGAPGADGGAIRIRGINSFGGSSTAPLVLIDGIEGSLDSVDPVLIESISILKDAASSSIYGSRAANGVILVTTKRSSTERFTVTYKGTVGWQSPTDLPETVNALEYRELTNAMNLQDGNAPTYDDESMALYRKNMGKDPDLYPNTDWQDAVLTGSGLSHSHTVSLGIGSERVRMLTTLGYVDQNGIIETTDFQRYTFRNNADVKFNDKLSMKLDLSFSNGDRRSSPYQGTIFNYMNTRSADIPNQFSTGLYNGLGLQGNNPVALMLEGGQNKNNTLRLSGAITLTYEPVEWLSLQGMLAPRYATTNKHNWKKPVTTYQDMEGTATLTSTPYATLTESGSRAFYGNYNFLMTFKKNFSGHDLKLILGAERNTYDYKYLSAYRQVFNYPDYDQIDVGEIENMDNSGHRYEWAIQSYFGRLNYNFKERYLFEANVRFDGSSRFAKGNRWGIFPSFSGAWRLTEEPFMQDVRRTLSEFKIRASYGQLGNQNIGSNYPTIQQLDVSSISVNDVITPIVTQTTLANPDITWESTEMYDVGIDATLFDKLSVTADWYYKKTHDILLTLDIPSIIGLGAPYQNAGTVRNVGWEVAVGYHNKWRDFSFGVEANLSDVVNKIIDMKGTTGGSGAIRNQEGSAINSIYGLKCVGMARTQEEADWVNENCPQYGVTTKPGDLIYADMDDSGTIDDKDMTIIGSTVPRYTYGVNLSFGWKGLNLSAFFQGVGKVDGYLSSYYVQPCQQGGTFRKEHLDRWNETNPNGKYPRLTMTDANNWKQSSFWMRSAAYCRLKNIQLSYTLPRTWLKKLRMKSAMVFVNAQNLFTITDFYQGFDPEVAYSGSGDGVELGAVAYNYPQVKVVTMGVELKF